MTVDPAWCWSMYRGATCLIAVGHGDAHAGSDINGNWLRWSDEDADGACETGPGCGAATDAVGGLMAVPRKCMASGCPNEADVVLIVSHADLLRRERPYCTPCADARRRMFPDRIKDEVTL